MNSLLKLFLEKGLLFDAFGIIGLGLLGIAALRLARRSQSWGGNMMAAGAMGLLLGRLYILLAPHFVTDDILRLIGPVGISLTIALPPLLLTFGLAGIVWGLWGHERWLNHENH
jgi:hypothetical protein